MIENVGNLVCPALFDLGERAKVVILSVTEGDDKPLKYPHMFRAADIMILNKIDLLPHVDFDRDRARLPTRSGQSGDHRRSASPPAPARGSTPGTPGSGVRSPLWRMPSLADPSGEAPIPDEDDHLAPRQRRTDRPKGPPPHDERLAGRAEGSGRRGGATLLSFGFGVNQVSAARSPHEWRLRRKA